MCDERVKQLVPLLTAWYKENRRPLPWRTEPTPYHVWVSEIMLQQTRIEAAIPYYARFMAALPTVEALAAVEDDALMKLWEGLGYYSRARNLKKAAGVVVSEYGGRLPEQAAALKKLPGIGDYTAGAIASIAYGQPEPAVDGNVLRVMMRLLASDEDVLQAKTRARVTELLRRVYPSGREAGRLTEALMELGEVVCVPNAAPRCLFCPLQGLCLAHERGETELYPLRPAKKERRREERTVLLLRYGGRFALRRREDKGLLAGMWEFPNLPGRADEAAVRAFLEEQGTRVLDCAPCGRARHIFSHVEWHMEGWRVDCGSQAPGFVWVTPEQLREEYALPTAFRYYSRQLL